MNFSSRYLPLLLVLLSAGAACKKETAPPSPSITGSLSGLWDAKEKHYRLYNNGGQLVTEETLSTSWPKYKYQLTFEASTYRSHGYVGGTLSYDTTFVYTRQGSLIRTTDHMQEYKILELTDQRLTLEYKVIKPGGVYTIEEDRYTR